jgi:predicted nucleic acid-binding protein
LSVVLDASVALAWCFQDEGGDYPTGVLASLRTGEGVVASHWMLEVTNGLLVAERRGRITSPEVSQVVGHLLALPIVVDPVERSRALTATHRLARTRGLSSYDAAYLELAVRLGLPLATLDEDLREAAAAEGVELYQGSQG